MDSPENASFIKSFLPPFLFVVLLWIIKWLEIVLGYDLYQLGILPRNVNGLVGIIAAPLIHGDLKHLFSNTSPVLVLGTGIFYFYKRTAYGIIAFITIFSGMLIWALARGGTYHIGASGLIYGFAFFLFFSGLLKKNKAFMAVSLIVILLYGSMLWGILPGEEGISWESHLFGSIAGSLAAYLFRKQGPKPPEKYHWENEADNDENVTFHISDYKKMPLDE